MPRHGETGQKSNNRRLCIQEARTTAVRPSVREGFAMAVRHHHISPARRSLSVSLPTERRASKLVKGSSVADIPTACLFLRCLGPVVDFARHKFFLHSVHLTGGETNHHHQRTDVSVPAGKFSASMAIETLVLFSRDSYRKSRKRE